MVQRFLIALLMALLVTSFMLTSRAEAEAVTEPVLSPQELTEFLDSFDQVWTTIRDRHWEKDPGGLDWNAMREEYRPRVENASSAREARLAMIEMLDRLGQSHFAIIPRRVYEEMSLPDGSGFRDGWAGIDARAVNGRALVTSVEPGSPAAEAGVRPGWIIARVEEDDIAPLLETLSAEFADSLYLDTVQAGVVLGRLSGPVGDQRSVTFIDGEDQPVDVDFALAGRKGRRVQFGFLPPTHVWIEVDSIEDDIGYVRFNLFLDPVNLMPAFNGAMKSFMDSAGIIIDLRGNEGGMGEMAMGMAGWLVEGKSEYLGTAYMNGIELKVIIYPRSSAYGGPVAVLVDGLSASCSELFSGGLQALGRARVIGSRTAGAVLPSTVEKLPSGDGFQYAHAAFTSRSGDVLEGVGVKPDIEVGPNRQALLEGRDPAIEAAVAWIRNRSDSRAGLESDPIRGRSSDPSLSR